MRRLDWSVSDPRHDGWIVKRVSDGVLSQLKRPLVSVIDRTGEAEQMSLISIWTPSSWIKHVKHGLITQIL